MSQGTPDPMAVCRLKIHKKPISQSIPNISAIQIAVYLYSARVIDRVLRDSIIKDLKPANRLWEVVVKLTQTEPNAYPVFLDALSVIDRHGLVEQIESSQVLGTLTSHLDILGAQLITDTRNRISNFVDYFSDETFPLIITEEPVSQDRHCFDINRVTYSHLHHNRDSVGSSTPSAGISSRLTDTGYSSWVDDIKLWNLAAKTDLAFLHGKSTLVDGSPGIGKSTLCGQIIAKFLRGKLPKFQNVVFISCRSLRVFADQRVSFAELMGKLGYHFDFDLASPSIVDSLFVFDAFEEFHGRVKFASLQPEMSVSLNETEKTVDAWLKFLICSPGKSVMIITRPGALRFLENCPFKVRLRVFGFSDKTIREFFAKYKATDKLEWLEQTKDYLSVYSHLYKPVNCAMYIGVFNDPQFNGSELPATSTDLYKRIFLLQIQKENYLHMVPQITGIKTKICMDSLLPSLTAIIENQKSKPEHEKTKQFLETVGQVCYQMIINSAKPENKSYHFRSDQCDHSHALSKSEIEQERAFELAKRSGLFVHYDSSVFFEREDFLLPIHSTLVEFGASLYLIKRFYKHVGYAIKNAARNGAKIFSQKLSTALLGDSEDISDVVIRFAIALLAQAEPSVAARKIFAVYHSNSLGKHLNINTLLKVNQDIPESTTWFQKLKQRVSKYVNDLFEAMPPESYNTIDSNLRLKIDNSDDRMQASVLYSIIQILKDKALTSKMLPAHVDLHWIRYPWVVKSIMCLPSYATNLTGIRLWGCRFYNREESFLFLKSCTALKELRIQWCKLSKISVLPEVMTFINPNLSVLCLSGNEILLNQSHMEALSRLVNLKSLLLYGNRLESTQLLSSLPSQLEELSLAKTGLDLEEEFNFAQKFPKLLVLDLSANKIPLCSGLSLLPETLEELDLQRNDLAVELDEQSLKLNYLVNLKTLHLNSNKLGNELFQTSENIFPNSLTELDLTDIGLSINGQNPIDIFSKLPRSLNHLSLAANFIKFKNTCESLEMLTELKTLDMTDIKHLFEQDLKFLFDRLPSGVTKISLPEYCSKFEMPQHDKDLVVEFE